MDFQAKPKYKNKKVLSETSFIIAVFVFFIIFTIISKLSSKYLFSQSEFSKNTKTKIEKEYYSKGYSKKRLSKFKKKENTLKIKVNLNTATVKELIKIKGIGEKTAQKIIRYREEHGDFSSVEELLNVKGIGKKKLEKIRPYVYIE